MDITGYNNRFKSRAPIDNKLHNMFWSEYDHTLVVDCLEKNAVRPKTPQNNFQSIGQGADFNAFKVNSSKFEFAVKFTDGQVIGQRQTFKRQWLLLLQAVIKLKCPLVPPMHGFFHGDLTVYVMPYGETPIKTRGLQSVTNLWPNEWHQCQKILKDAGLYLNDVPQIKEAYKTPFIIDWSDILPIES